MQKGADEMKKNLLLIIIIVAVHLLPISLTFAFENDAGQLFLASAKLNYSDSHSGDQKQDIMVPYSLKFNDTATEEDNIVGKSENNKSKSPAGLTNQQYQSNIFNPSVPEEIVNSLSQEFYMTDASSSSRSRGFDMDVPTSLSEVFIIGTAFLTNLFAHEFGHEVVAQHVGATGTELNFFKKMNGQFFLGTSVVDNIADESILPYTMGGEFFADLTFEHALQDYRQSPNLYNKALLLSSGLDFAWYCLYAFYVGNESPSYDPITISKETGISRDMLFSVVVAKTMINAYRVYSGNDTVIPYFTVDKNSAMLNIAFPFEIKDCIFKDCNTPVYEG